MRAGFWLGLGLALAFAFSSAAQEEGTQSYGAGLICPRADSQISFYTENNQQDAAGTIGYAAATGFAITSDTIKTMTAAEAQTMDGLCDGGMPGIRIESKRDGWLQAGKMWIPPNQEWDYGDWQDYLHKAAVWKPLEPLSLFEGSADAPAKEKPYADAVPTKGIEIYPLKFADDYALVLLDRSGAYAKTCAGTPTPPEGKMGWLHLTSEGGRTVQCQRT